MDPTTAKCIVDAVHSISVSFGFVGVAFALAWLFRGIAGK